MGLAKYDKTLDWRKIAVGITISGIQQQRPIDHSTYKFKDYIPDCGHAGMYPDAYSAVKGTDAYHWCLSGDRITQNVYDLIGSDPDVKYNIVWSEDEKRRVHISSAAYIENAVLTDGHLKFGLTFHDHPYNKTHHIVVANFVDPVSVTKNGKTLNRENNLDDASEGYRWMPQLNAVMIKIIQDSKDVLLELQ